MLVLDDVSVWSVVGGLGLFKLLLPCVVWMRLVSVLVDSVETVEGSEGLVCVGRVAEVVRVSFERVELLVFGVRSLFVGGISFKT